MNDYRRRMALVLTMAWLAASGRAADTNQIPATSANLPDLTLDQLVNIQVTSVSKKETSLENSPAAIAVVTADDISRLGITSVPEALRLVPGMDVAQINASTWAVSVRGFNAQFGDKLLVLIDGRSVYTPSSGGVFWNAQDVMMQDLDRIEVIRGPGSALWGANAMDGVINIVSKSAKETQGLLINGEAGSEVQDIASVRYGGVLASNLYYRVYGQRSDYDGLTETSGQSVGDNWHSTLGGFRLDYEPPTQNVLTLQGDYLYQGVGKSSALVSISPPGVSYPTTVENTSGANLLGRWTHEFSSSSQLTLQTYIDNVDEGSGYGEEEVRNTYDVDLQFRFAVGSWNDIVCGTGYRYASDQNTEAYELIWSPETRYIEIFNLFAQDEITIVPDRFHLTLGTKLEYDSLVGWEPQPDARLLWTPDEKQSVWASVSRATATPALVYTSGRLNVDAFPTPPPGPAALVSILGNPNLGVERLTATEIGYRVEPTKRLSFDVTGFYNDYDNLIVAAPNPTRFETGFGPPHLLISSTWQNAGAGDTHGIELSAQWRVMDSWRLVASYSWLGTALNSASASSGRSPSQQAQLRSYLDLPYHLQLNGALYFVDRSASPLSDGVDEIPAYARADLGLTWHPRPWLEMGVWGENLLQTEHVEFSSQQSPGLTEVPRSVVGKVTLRF